ncbi:serine/threonine-protein kinase [Nocardia terpenica]|uniref:non-specific serine/threonine protein kinase n=1 Tax=Nocardia terpenica TaxID=455432 RepID=A0A164KL09_9NOCA|nr:serine/threonine-protein kinase [Nocardia terpenica]KZM71500.1 hypothetical protein AWN90_01770 [Nocardia terpenica]
MQHAVAVRVVQRLGDLADDLHRPLRRQLPPERAVQIVGEVAEALDYAHRNGVLHRDVKPANMLLARSTGGKGERVYLPDFGIARLRDDGGHLTQTGTFTATLAYASPEQLTGAALDGRADQYSLACSLFWLFTGSGPFPAPSPAAVIRGHLQGPPPALSSVRPGLPRSLDAILIKAMSKRADDRFESCAASAPPARRAFAPPSAPPIPVAPQGTGMGGALGGAKARRAAGAEAAQDSKRSSARLDIALIRIASRERGRPGRTLLSAGGYADSAAMISRTTKRRTTVPMMMAMVRPELDFGGGRGCG